MYRGTVVPKRDVQIQHHRITLNGYVLEGLIWPAIELVSCKHERHMNNRPTGIMNMNHTGILFLSARHWSHWMFTIM